MLRQPRYNLPGFPQHVIQRGNNRQKVFFDESINGVKSINGVRLD